MDGLAVGKGVGEAEVVTRLAVLREADGAHHRSPGVRRMAVATRERRPARGGILAPLAAQDILQVERMSEAESGAEHERLLAWERVHRRDGASDRHALARAVAGGGNQDLEFRVAAVR